jgi:hypothetical protein
VARRRWSESRDDRAGRASSVPEHSSYCWQVKTAVISVFQSRDASIPGQLGRPPPPTSQDPRARVSIHQGSRQKSRTSSIDHLLAKSRPGSARSANRAAASLRRAAGWHRLPTQPHERGHPPRENSARAGRLQAPWIDVVMAQHRGSCHVEVACTGSHGIKFRP